jgi:triosephosphate isomerase
MVCFIITRFMVNIVLAYEPVWAIGTGDELHRAGTRNA